MIEIEESFGIVTSCSKRIHAILHDGLYKPWTSQVLKDFSDEFEEDEQD